MSVKGGHVKCQEMAKCQSKEVTEMTDFQSMRIICTKAFSGWSIGDVMDELLLVWLPTSQTIKTDLVMGEIDFSADETMSPKRIKEIGSSLNFDLTTVIRTTQIDDSACERKLVIGLPILRERTSRGTSVNAWRRALSSGESEAIGTSLDGIVVLVEEALPDPLLPATVEAFDDSLEASLMGWREDGDNVELQAEADDTTKGVRKLTCSAENSVVVELGVLREPVSAPMGNQRIGGDFGGPRGSDPTGTQARLETDGSHDVHVSAALQAQVFDEVEAVDVGLSGSDAWQVPAFRRRGSTHSSPSVESTSAQEDSANGADGGNLHESALFENKLDGRCTVLTQVALMAELLTNSQDQILSARRRGDFLAPTTARNARPNDAFQPLVPSVTHPPLHGCQCHTKLLCHRPLRASPSNSSDELFATRFNPVFCSRKAPGRKDIYDQCDLL